MVALPEKVTFYDYENGGDRNRDQYRNFTNNFHLDQQYQACQSGTPSPPRYQTLSGNNNSRGSNKPSKFSQFQQSHSNVYLPPKNPLAKPLKTRQSRRKKSSFQISYESTWYTSLPVLMGVTMLILCLISLKADKGSPWIWQQLNYFFTFLIETILIPVKLAGPELCGVFVNIIILAGIFFRIKQHKTVINQLNEDEEILTGHIELLKQMNYSCHEIRELQ